MRKDFKRGLKAVGCIMLVAVLTLTGVQLPGQGLYEKGSGVAVAEAATATSRVPAWVYMRSGSGKLYTYTSSALTTRTGYIEPGDYCKITAFYSNGAVRVVYPTSRGSRTAYASMSGFLGSTNFNTSTRTLGIRATAYRRSTGNAAMGTVFASDNVTIICNANGRTQLIYPCSGGYKIGWVQGTYTLGNNPQGWVDSVTSTAKGTITVRGWTFDKDSLGTALAVHVYVGGPAGSGAPGYAITANTSRPDVHKAYRCGNYHGFDRTINVSRTGNQTVYIYAINVGGGNSNPLIGTKNVNIVGGSSTNSTNGVRISLKVPNYKQYSYPNTYIGNKTIKQIGCTLTSVAMAYSYNTRTNTTPNVMKGKLRFGGTNGNDLVWSSLANVGLSYSGSYGCRINNSIMSTIYSKLRAGRPVIIGGMTSGGSAHWVCIKGYTGGSATSFSSGSFTINDPNSTSRTTLAQFLNSYPIVLRLIY